MTYFFEFIAWILYYHGPPVFTATGNSSNFATFPVVSLGNAETPCMLMTRQIWVVLQMVEMKGNQQ